MGGGYLCRLGNVTNDGVGLLAIVERGARMHTEQQIVYGCSTTYFSQPCTLHSVNRFHPSKNTQIPNVCTTKQAKRKLSSASELVYIRDHKTGKGFNDVVHYGDSITTILLIHIHTPVLDLVVQESKEPAMDVNTLCVVGL